MIRAAVSIPSNIAEGSERNSNKDFERFLSISKGSSAELRTQYMILSGINSEFAEFQKNIDKELDEVSNMMEGLIKKISNDKVKQ